MNSQEMLQYIAEKKPSGEIRESFANVVNWMFANECYHANLPPGLCEPEFAALQKEDKLLAIKYYKRRVGCSLMDAKIQVENYMRKHYGKIHFSSPRSD